MLYFVKCNYGFTVEASSRDDAYRKAITSIREAPGVLITGVGAKEDFAKKKSLLWRIFSGA